MEGKVHVRLDAGVPGSGKVSEWLEFVRAMNGVEPGIAGSPEIKPWWAGGTVEEYPDFYLIHRTDPTVSIVSKTELGERVIHAVAAQRGVRVA